MSNSNSNVNFFVEDNNNTLNYDEMDIDAQLASVLSEEEYSIYINSKLDKDNDKDNDNYGSDYNHSVEFEFDNDNDNDNDNQINNYIDNFIHLDNEQLMLFYNDSNVKSLTQLLQYYGIYKPKMLKNEMIQVLVFFETQKENKNSVRNRIRLWHNIEELKSHPFFGKYIMF
jgi:hypothetical protein